MASSKRIMHKNHTLKKTLNIGRREEERERKQKPTTVRYGKGILGQRAAKLF